MHVGVMVGERMVTDRGLLACEQSWTMDMILSKFKERAKKSSNLPGCHDSPEVFIGSNEESKDFNLSLMDTVDSCMTVQDITKFDEKYNRILFKFMWDTHGHNQEQSKGEEKVDAFKFMMASSSERNVVPEKIMSPRNGKERLNNFVVDYIIKLKTVRFTKQEKHMQHLIMNTLTNGLWAIDGHHNKFDRAPNVSNIPRCFRQKEIFRNLFSQGEKKKKLPNLNKDELVSPADALNCLATKP